MPSATSSTDVTASRTAARTGQADVRLDRLVTASDVVLTAGAGGVGKTSVAAALAATAAVELEAKVLVLTVDPARRLATAMGLSGFGNVERRVGDDAFAAAGAEPRGELWAAMLDTKASWDDLVRRHAPDRATAEAILANPLYRNITATFVQSHDYIAMERLHELHASGRYDLIVIDTPPSRHAIDFLDAPARMADFFSSRLLRWLIAPYRSRLANLASKPFNAVADRLLGASFLADIAEFFLLFQSMYGGFVERAKAVEQTLGDPRTSFVVVTTLEPAPVQEATWFCEELERRRLRLGAVVFNRVLPVGLDDAAARTVAGRFQRRPDAAADRVLAALAPGAVTAEDAPRLRQVLDVAGQSFLDYAMLAAREAELASRLGATAGLTASIPQLDHDVADLSHLLELGRAAWGP
jgi:anion-transporting  ArsA/GET3 family ATPase